MEVDFTRERYDAHNAHERPFPSQKRTHHSYVTDTMAEQSDPERQKAELEPHNTDATYNDDETEDDVITFIDPEEQEMLTASRLDDDEMEYELKKAERAAAAVAREEEDRNSALTQEQ